MSALRVRLFACVVVVLMIAIGFSGVVQRWKPTVTPPKVHDPGGPLGPQTNPYLPSSQTLTNATQTGGNCGTTWTNLQSSDDVRCSYREVNTAPASPTKLLPNANGDVVSWTVSGTGGAGACDSEANEWKCVDEDPNDGDTTYIKSTSSTNPTDSIENLGTVSFNGASVSSVVANLWCRRTTSSSVAVRTLIKTNGVLFAGASDFNCPNSSTYGTTSSTYATNPQTGLAWTQAQVDALQARCRDKDATTLQVRCSEIRADVNFNLRYSLEVRFAWSNVPLTGDRWTLVVECQRLNPGAENVLVQVGQGGNPPTNWVTAYTCSSDTDQAFSTYKLSAAELNNGAPLVRVWDNQQAAVDSTAGTMALDVLRIDRDEYRTGYNPWHYYIDKMVNADNGNLHLSFRDLTAKALGWNLEVLRAYNHRLADTDGLMGRGWTFGYETKIVEEATGIAQWWDPDGSVHTFRLSGSTWLAPAGIDAKLTKSTTFTLWFKDGSKFTFNTQGRLSTMVDRNGNTLTLTWSLVVPVSLQTIADQSGLQLTFTSDCGGGGVTCRVKSVLDPIGRTVRYAYDASHRMISHTDAMGNNTWYTYDASHRLLTWREPANPLQLPLPAVQRVTFRYDTSDRADQIKRASVNGATNATIYEYVAYGITFQLLTAFPGASYATNATNARSIVTSIDLASVGTPLRIRGPQCGECASLAQGPPNGKLACCGGSGCGGSKASITEEIQLTWDANFNLMTRKDKGNHQFTYTYDSRRNLLNTTDPLGNVTRNVWTNVDNATAYLSTLNKTTNARGFTWFYEYTTPGNLKQAKDPTNNVSKYAYTTKGYVSKYTDWRGFNTTFDYDSHGYLLNRTDATGNRTTFQNDGIGRLTRITHPDTHFFRTEYDKNDRVMRTIDELNNATTLTWNARNDLLARQDPLGRVTTFEWNATNHMVARMIDALGNSTTIGYDLVVNVVKVTNWRGFNTTLTYDNFNRRTVVKDALNNETQYTYDGDGLVTSVRDRRGFRTNYTYDANHRTKTVKDALGNVTVYDYDQVSNLVKVNNGRGFETTYTYDKIDRMTEVTDALGNFTRFDYDANGNVVTVRDPNANLQPMTYDAIDRMKTVTNALGFVTTSSYDSENNLVQVKDAEGRLTSYTYDALNRRTQVKDALNDTTNFTYDAVGNLLNITDDNGRVTLRKYDALNRLIDMTSPLGKTTRFTYDANGNVKTRKDALLRTTTYTYDALDRLMKTAYPTTNLTFTYDGEGNRLTAVGFGFARTDVYDALNRVMSTTFNYGSFSKQIQYTYDQVGNRKTMRYPEGPLVDSTYDALDRLTTLQDSSVGSWSFVYDAASRRTRITHPSGLKTEFAYNKADWVLGVYTNTSGGAVVESFTYTYDKVGNRKTMVENGGNTSAYGYDATYRLKNESYTGGLLINYTYNGVGNRLTDVRNGVTTSYTYDDDNRLAAQGTTTYGYDDNGNRIRKTSAGQDTTYAWDIENRLTGVTFPNATTVQYEYSTDGNRMSRTEAGIKTWYAYDFRDANGLDEVIGEYNVTGGLVAHFVQGPGGDQPLAKVSGGVAYFYSSDALGSVTRLTTTTQTTGARYRYEAFGTSRDSLEGPPNSFRFASRELDSATGLYFYRARWYHASTGTFLSRDPERTVDGPNAYVYVRNNPINRVDPSGAHDFWTCMKENWWAAIISPVATALYCRAHHTDWGCVANCIASQTGGFTSIQFVICWFAVSFVCSRAPSRACLVGLAACAGIAIGVCWDRCTTP